jgi:hypothetical protein
VLAEREGGAWTVLADSVLGHRVREKYSGGAPSWI